MGKVAKLIMVTEKNNNKFYDMAENGDGTFTVTWGRVDSTSQKNTYPMHKWNAQYNSKIKKGYVDVTHLSSTSDSKVNFTDISDKSINNIINRLMNFSKKVVEVNYSVSASKVTTKMISEAQNIIDEIIRYTNNLRSISLNSVENINSNLLSLFKVLPRKMNKVQNFLISTDIIGEKFAITVEIINKIVMREQDTLDSLSAMVALDKVDGTTTKETKITILDKLGIEMREKDSNLEKTVLNMLGEIKDKYINCWYVTNKKTQKKYDEALSKAKDKKEEKFWHGSRNENWLNILEKGLILKPANSVFTGSMFNDSKYGALYFANKARKSYGYCSTKNSYWVRGNSSTAIMALYNVNIGNQYIVNEHTAECYKFSSEYLKKKGNYDSVLAKAGKSLRNDEIVIFEPEKCTIFCLVELKD